MRTFFNRCALIMGAFIVAALFFAHPAHADSWTGPDKAKHAAVSAGLGLVAAAAVKDDRAAFALALAPGLAKELYDSRRGGTGFSIKDMAANAVGAYLGIKLGGVILRPHFIGKQWSLNL